jgi:hypothetical protein
MLKPACRRFRTRFPDAAADAADLDLHRSRCPACAAWAAAMARAAVRLPLPPSLRRELGKIPVAGVDGPRLPLPQKPLPAPLHNRLRSVARPRQLPRWLRSPRYAVAASYLAAVLAIYLLGDPVLLGRQALDAAERRCSRVWSAAAADESLRGLESRVKSTYGETRQSLAATLSTLSSRVAAARELLPEPRRRPR